MALGSLSGGLLAQMRRLLGAKASVGAAQLQALEISLIQADVGPVAAAGITERVRKLAVAQPGAGDEALVAALKQALRENLVSCARGLAWPASGPLVLCLVGVNGSGKTTTAAKIAHHLGREGKRVVLGACDTFRAAAVEQLEIWAQRAGADCIRGPADADPASVAHNAVAAGVARKANAVLLDTAGRLHTKAGLMEEARKIARVVQKIIPDAPQETLLVLDATNGQNALSVVHAFCSALSVTGLILSKMDAGSKAGVVVAVERESGIPVKFVGTGERLEDLQDFDAEAFVNALAGDTDACA